MRIDPLALDLGSLAYFAGLAAQEAVLADLSRTHRGLRFAHGYVFQHLIAGPRDVGALATLMDVTSQAASKTVRELKRLGYVTVTTSRDDARKSVVTLSKKGHASIAAARALRAKQERALVRAVGQRDLDGAKRTLAKALSMFRGEEAVRNRRVRAPR
jgi:DNA-binding MarR family transcriptional regulator